MVQALGGRLRAARGAPGAQLGRGGVALLAVRSLELAELHPALRTAELHPALRTAAVVVAGAVDNPLLGPRGAAARQAGIGLILELVGVPAALAGAGCDHGRGLPGRADPARHGPRGGGRGRARGGHPGGGGGRSLPAVGG